MAPELFAGVTIWLAIGAGAAWLLLSGRRFFFGFPIGLKEGRQMRLFGLVYVAAAVYYGREIILGTYRRDSLIGTVVIIVVLVWLYVDQMRKQRNRVTTRPGAPEGQSPGR
jgi:hypothetical protein